MDKTVKINKLVLFGLASRVYSKSLERQIVFELGDLMTLRKKMVGAMAWAAVLFWTPGCGSDLEPIGSCGDYQNFEGIITIESIEDPVDESWSTCGADSKVVTYAFSTTDTSIDPERYSVSSAGFNESFTTLVDSSGRLLTDTCVESIGLEVGQTFPATRSIGGAPCTPLIDYFQDLQTQINTCQDDCN